MFHPRNTKGLKKPTFKTGRGMCLIFHTCSHCWKDCKYLSGHAEIDDKEAQVLCTFLDDTRNIRDRLKEFQGGERKVKRKEDDKNVIKKLAAQGERQ